MKKNTKVIRLTENDLERMVRRIITESDDNETEDMDTREDPSFQDDENMYVPKEDEDYMSAEDDLINAAYELMYDLGYEYVEDLYIQDLNDAAYNLEEELYEGNHGPVMDKMIEDLLTKIYEIIGYPDEAEDWDESEY